jgi:hypothetical protein
LATGGITFMALLPPIIVNAQVERIIAFSSPPRLRHMASSTGRKHY